MYTTNYKKVFSSSMMVNSIYIYRLVAGMSMVISTSKIGTLMKSLEDYTVTITEEDYFRGQ